MTAITRRWGCLILAILPIGVGCQIPMMFPSAQSAMAPGGHGMPPVLGTEIFDSTIPGERLSGGRLIDQIAPVKAPPSPDSIPRELTKVSLPVYTVGPPDVLLIEALKTVPKEPYKIGRLDQLQIQAENVLEDRPIQGTYNVGSNGSVDLGPPYGSTKVVGLTIQQAQDKIEKQMQKLFKVPAVTVSLAQPAAVQQISGEHLIGVDGTVNLGVYGRVFVTGMTISEVEEAVEKALSESLEDPDVSVDVFSYNSKSYYLIIEGFTRGDGIRRIAITGNETVLDAIADANGLQPTSSRTRIWLARPSPDHQHDQILPVDYQAIVMLGDAATNYQLLPGDRLYISEDRFEVLDATIGRLIAPFERIFGTTLLGAQTIQTINRFPSGTNSGGQQQF